MHCHALGIRFPFASPFRCFAPVWMDRWMRGCMIYYRYGDMFHIMDIVRMTLLEKNIAFMIVV